MTTLVSLDKEAMLDKMTVHQGIIIKMTQINKLSREAVITPDVLENQAS